MGEEVPRHPVDPAVRRTEVCVRKGGGGAEGAELLVCLPPNGVVKISLSLATPSIAGVSMPFGQCDTERERGGKRERREEGGRGSGRAQPRVRGNRTGDRKREGATKASQKLGVGVQGE